MTKKKNKAGGARRGAGRKPKVVERALIERLSIYDAHVEKKLFELIDEGDFKAIALFYAYRYGKPKETKDIKVSHEQPLFNLGDIDDAVIIEDDSDE